MATSSRRWRALAAGLLVEAAAGTAYAFGVYGSQLKEKLGWTQTQLESVGSYGNLGLYAGFIAGVAFDYWGSRPTILVGILLSFLGYGMMWAGADGHFGASGSVAFMGLAAAIWSHGSSWYDTAAIASMAKNFPGDRGRVLGLLKSLFGLSAALVAQFYLSFFKPDAVALLAFLAFYLSGLGFLGFLFVDVVPAEEATPLGRSGLRRTNFATTVIFVLAVFLSVTAILQSQWLLHGSESLAEMSAAKAFSYVLIGMVALNLLIAVNTRLWGAGSKDEPAEAYLLDYRNSSEGGPVPGSTPDVSFASTMKDANLYIVFLAIMCGTGAGLMVINNLAEMTESLGGTKGSQDVFVTLLSVFNCGGRVLAGFLSDKFAARVIRPVWLAIALLGMGASQILLAFSPLTLFYVAIPLVGLFYGSFWSLLPTIVADVWGTKAFGKIYSVVGLAPGVGSILMAQQLAGRIYDANVNAAGNKCDGHVCFRLTHFLLAGFCAVGAFAALALARRLRRHYAMLREGSSRFSVTKGVRATSSVQVADTGRLASGDSAGPSLGSDDIYS